MPFSDLVGRIVTFFRPARITDLAALADFIDGQSAFLSQKTLFEYARARAGTNWDKLFKEPQFKKAIEEGRWRAYAAVLLDVSEMVHAYLRRAPETDPRWLAASLADLVADEVLPRHPVPPHLISWDEFAHELSARLGRAAEAAPRMAHEIGYDGARAVYDALPIHSAHTGHDYELVQNHLRFNLAQARSTLEERLDLEDWRGGHPAGAAGED